MGHAAAAPCRLRACGCTTASGTPMPIRVPWPWMGATPHLGMPRSASGRMEPDSPILPSAAGSLPASSPCRKAIERRFEKTDYCVRECQGPSSPLVPASVVVGPFSRAVPGNGAAGAARCSSARRTSGRRADESPPSKRRPTLAGARPGGPLGTLRLARASSAHDAPLPVGGSEGARPPASLRRGTAKRGPKEDRRPGIPSPRQSMSSECGGTSA